MTTIFSGYPGADGPTPIGSALDVGQAIQTVGIATAMVGALTGTAHAQYNPNAPTEVIVSGGAAQTSRCLPIKDAADAAADAAGGALDSGIKWGIVGGLAPVVIIGGPAGLLVLGISAAARSGKRSQLRAEHKKELDAWKAGQPPDDVSPERWKAYTAQKPKRERVWPVGVGALIFATVATVTVGSCGLPLARYTAPAAAVLGAGHGAVHELAHPSEESGDIRLAAGRLARIYTQAMQAAGIENCPPAAP